MAIYSEDYFDGAQKDGYADYLGSEPILRREFQGALRSLGKAGRTGGKLFEIGSAYGFFLAEARNHFAVSGIEVCEKAAAYCRDRGLDVDTGPITEQALAARAPFDVMAMLDVIEHLTDPLGVLRLANRYLSPGGHLLITTGDWDSTLSRCMRSSWRLMTPPQHAFFFSKRTIRSILGRAGFRVVSITRPWKWVPIGLILFQLARIVGFRPTAIAVLSRYAMPVNLFDAMRVIAVKDGTAE
jgi:SAM-dependent methyltransferase